MKMAVPPVPEIAELDGQRAGRVTAGSFDHRQRAL